MKAEELARWTSGAGAGCLRFDYSGHGRSGGRFEDGTISAWLDEAAAVYAAALGQGMPAVFVGSSMGAWIALLLARRLVTRGHGAAEGHGSDRASLGHDAPHVAAFTAGGARRHRTRRRLLSPLPLWRWPLPDHEETHRGWREPSVFGEGPVPLDVPIRILHGCQDPDVPWRHSLDLLDGVAGADIRLTLIKDGEHRLSRPQDLALLRAALAEFL